MTDHELVLQTHDLHKTYHLGDVEVQALRGITLDVSRGEFLIITGRNGSGKSTLLRQLGLLDAPTAGTVHLLGQDVTHLPERLRRAVRLESVGYVFQEYALVPELTAKENVMVPAMMRMDMRSSATRAQEVLESVGLSHRIRHLPRQLSGGEQQKVAIARALVNHPALLFADEPTANLDTTAAHDVLGQLQRLNREGTTVVMVSHEPEEQQYASRVFTLADGRVA